MYTVHCHFNRTQDGYAPIVKVGYKTPKLDSSRINNMLQFMALLVKISTFNNDEDLLRTPRLINH